MSGPAAAVRRGPVIGTVALESPVVQAALSGYSDRAMRVLARRHGAAYALGEVLLEILAVCARSKLAAVVERRDETIGRAH